MVCHDQTELFGPHVMIIGPLVATSTASVVLTPAVRFYLAFVYVPSNFCFISQSSWCSIRCPHSFELLSYRRTIHCLQQATFPARLTLLSTYHS